jgi:toxin ParE1/3/4
VNLEFHPEAEREFREAALYYDLRVAGLGEKFLSEIKSTTELLIEQPKIGARIDPNLRRLLLGRFPYSVIYSVEETTIRVIAIAHQRRRPGYWRTR